jgi:hypothetical protein
VQQLTDKTRTSGESDPTFEQTPQQIHSGLVYESHSREVEENPGRHFADFSADPFQFVDPWPHELAFELQQLPLVAIRDACNPEHGKFSVPKNRDALTRAACHGRMKRHYCAQVANH